MCTITTAIVSAIAAISTAVTSTAVSLTQASAEKKAAEYEMEQTKKEAQKMEMQAAYERQEGVEDARKQKLSAILNMTDSKANLASSNISMSSGLVLNLENDSKINSELDALTTQKQSERWVQSYLDRRDKLYSNVALKGFNTKVKSQIAGMNIKNNAIQDLGRAYEP